MFNILLETNHCLNHLDRTWETIIRGDHNRLPAGILGLLVRKHFPGMVRVGDSMEPAMTWDHYKRVPDVPDACGREFGTVADRVVGELWVSLRCIILHSSIRRIHWIFFK